MVKPATPRPPLALIANDQEWSGRSIESILAPKGYAVLRAFTGRQTLEQARATSPDLIILASSLPDTPGLALCRRLRSDPSVGLGTPILMTTAGPMRRNDRLAALSAGAWDYLSLPLDGEELVLQLEHYMKAKLSADLSADACLVDTVTGLYNLRGLMKRAQELGSAAFRHCRPLACVALAPVAADTNGGGDSVEALQDATLRIAELLRLTGRVSDAIGRIRFAEFLIVAPDTDGEAALKLARRVVQAGDREIAAMEAGTARVVAGYDAVSDFREAGIRAADLLSGAVDALHHLQLDAPDGPIRRFEGDRGMGLEDGLEDAARGAEGPRASTE